MWLLIIRPKVKKIITLSNLRQSGGLLVNSKWGLDKKLAASSLSYGKIIIIIIIINIIINGLYNDKTSPEDVIRINTRNFV